MHSPRLRRRATASLRAPLSDWLASARQLKRPGRVDVALITVVALAAAFYEWTAQTSVSGYSQSYYYLLADSFLHLHTYLPIRVPPGLAAAPNPYLPSANAQFGLHDLLYYKDHLFLSWGPAPVLTLYLPLRLLGIEMTDVNAVPIYSIAALVFAVLLLRLVVRRFVPHARGWVVVAGACALAFGTAIPFMLRRPAIYEVAIGGGAAFMMAALYLLGVGLLREGAAQRRLLAAASLCAGLAFASRPPLLLGGGAFVVAAFVVWRRPLLTPRARRSLVVTLLGPLALCIALIAAYNTQRFGSPTQYGIPYQLAGADQQTTPTFDLAYLRPGVYNFALAPPRLALTFPHVFLPPPPAFPGPLPTGYDGSTPTLIAEPTGGIIPMAPIVLFALAIPLIWRRREAAGDELPLIALTLCVLGAGILFGLAFTLWGTTERYEVDFDLLLILAGILGWIGLLAVTRGRKRRRLAAVLGVLAVAWTCMTGVAVSFTGYYNELLQYHPGIFDTLEDITSPFATLPTMLLGHPVITRVQSPAPIIYGPIDYTTFGQGQASTYLGEGPVTIVVLAPGAENLSLRADVSPGFQPTGGPLDIVISSPGRAPTTEAFAPGVDLLPIHVHWGLNRIVLNMPGNPTGGLAIGLGDIVLVHRLPAAHSRPGSNTSANATQDARATASG